MGYSTILKTTCFRLTIRNVNGQGKTYHMTKKACFRLTIRNVNLVNEYDLSSLLLGFRLTIRNVNVTSFATKYSANLVLD